MAKYRVYGKVTGLIWLGVYEAISPQEAEMKAQAEHEDELYCRLCHQCADTYDMDPDVTEFIVEQDD